MTRCSISIVIPAYNVEKYLLAALESIKAQLVLPDEVILIDDGSTDGTLAVANSFDFPVPYQVTSIPNGGQGNARNLGVSLASSDYVYFFDADDLLEKQFIKSIKNEISQNYFPDIVLFSGQAFDDSDYSGKRWVDYSRKFSGVFNDRTEFLRESRSHKALFCSPCLYVSKKSFWGPTGLEFGSYFLEDEAIFFPLLFACNTFLVVDEIFFLRRNREGSTMTMKPNAKHVNGALNCMDATLGMYTAAGINDVERMYIRKRLESQCINYIVMARRAGMALKVGRLLKVIAAAKSMLLLTKVILYSTGADKSGTLRRVHEKIKHLREPAAK